MLVLFARNRRDVNIRLFWQWHLTAVLHARTTIYRLLMLKLDNEPVAALDAHLDFGWVHDRQYWHLRKERSLALGRLNLLHGHEINA